MAHQSDGVVLAIWQTSMMCSGLFVGSNPFLRADFHSAMSMEFLAVAGLAHMRLPASNAAGSLRITLGLFPYACTNSEISDAGNCILNFTQRLLEDGDGARVALLDAAVLGPQL